jgi:mannose-6-phosphate isomerase-like protein (cupin superfamily)
VSELFRLPELLTRVGEKGYHEFLRAPALSAGVYILPVGGTDAQKPHREDEIYCVVRGRAKIRLGSDERPVSEGDVIFVEAGLTHRFLDIAEELALLVVFAPAEST